MFENFGTALIQLIGFFGVFGFFIFQLLSENNGNNFFSKKNKNKEDKSLNVNLAKARKGLFRKQTNSKVEVSPPKKRWFQ